MTDESVRLKAKVSTLGRTNELRHHIVADEELSVREDVVRWVKQIHKALAAEGDFVVFLDHDDELTADCLYELALCIERDNSDYIYSDEDKISPQRDFVQPHFKPDWSPDTKMSTMFTCHVSCVRRSLLVELGGLRSAYDGCQDWDLVLRLAEVTQRISHIPKVLYHWRIIPASTAADIAAKSYVMNASKRVREDALKRRGLQGVVEAVT